MDPDKRGFLQKATEPTERTERLQLTEHRPSWVHPRLESLRPLCSFVAIHLVAALPRCVHCGLLKIRDERVIYEVDVPAVAVSR